MQPAATPLTDSEITELDTLLSSIHAPFEPMDVAALDGYLCGVLLQPVTIAIDAWLPAVLDVEGRAVPRGTQTQRIAVLAQRRRDELAGAIGARRWFEPIQPLLAVASIVLLAWALRGRLRGAVSCAVDVAAAPAPVGVGSAPDGHTRPGSGAS